MLLGTGCGEKNLKTLEPPYRRTWIIEGKRNLATRWSDALQECGDRVPQQEGSTTFISYSLGGKKARDTFREGRSPRVDRQMVPRRETDLTI